MNDWNVHLLLSMIYAKVQKLRKLFWGDFKSTINKKVKIWVLAYFLNNLLLKVRHKNEKYSCFVLNYTLKSCFSKRSSSHRRNRLEYVLNWTSIEFSYFWMMNLFDNLIDSLFGKFWILMQNRLKHTNEVCWVESWFVSSNQLNYIFEILFISVFIK